MIRLEINLADGTVRSCDYDLSDLLLRLALLRDRRLPGVRVWGLGDPRPA